MSRVNIEGLTVREIHVKNKTIIALGLEVLRHAACGLTDRQISKAMSLSLGAVKSRIKALYTVIGARNRAHAVTICVAQGWLNKADIDKSLETRQYGNMNDGRVEEPIRVPSDGNDIRRSNANCAELVGQRHSENND